MRKKRSPDAPRSLVDATPYRTTGGGSFPGLTHKDIEYESTNELNSIRTLALCHDVYQITSQPEKESYILDGIQRQYTPDLLVETFVPQLRLEVKSIGTLARDAVAVNKYLAIANTYRARGQPFALLTDVQLEERPRFGNVLLMSRYLAGAVPKHSQVAACQALHDGPMLAKHLMDVATLKLVDVLSLIAQRKVCFDWNKSWNPDSSMVSLPGQPYEGLRLENILRSTRYGDILEGLALGRRPTNKQLLEDAKTWRRNDCLAKPWSIVGECNFGKAMRALSPKEQLPRNPEIRRNFTIGQHPVAQ